MTSLTTGLKRSPALQKRRTTPDIVADSLREAILTGKLADGQELNSVELAEYFGVSRVPIREALRRLEAEGLVRQEAHRRAVVNRLTEERLMELFDLRIRLECYLLERAIPNIDSAKLERLRRLCDEMEAETVHSKWLDRNLAFHDALYRPSGADYAYELSEQIRRRATRYVYLSGGDTLHRLAPADEQHREILDAVADGDVPKATSLLTTHIESTRGLLKGKLD